MGLFSFLGIGGNEPPKPAVVQQAEACYSKEELASITADFHQACRAQGQAVAVLPQDPFVHLCGLPTCSNPCQPAAQQSTSAGDAGQQAASSTVTTLHWPNEVAGLLGPALFHACAGLSSRQQAVAAAGPAAASEVHAGVSADDLLVAKAACERLPTSDNHTFAFRLLCQLAATTMPLLRTAAHSGTAAGQAQLQASPSTTAAATAAAGGQLQQTRRSTVQQAREYEEQGLPLPALEACVAVLCAVLDTHTEQQFSMQLTHSNASSQTLTGPADAGAASSSSSTSGTTPLSSSAAAAQPISLSDVVLAASTQGPQTQQQPASADSDGGGGGGGGAAVLGAWVAAAARGALWTAAGPAASQPAQRLSQQGYTRWVKSVPAWHTLLSGLLAHVGASTASGAGGGVTLANTLARRLRVPRSPRLLVSHAGKGPANVRSAAPTSGLLLHPLAALLLSSCMPLEQREEWQLVFSSDRDGKSFNTLMGRLAAVEGATLILVREAGEAGHLVAGYASAAWRKSGAYFGEATTWVARLTPDMQVFTATGANANFQWCGQGFSQLTNGIGFGGAQGSIPAFALLLDATLDAGQSRPIATFGSPSLTSAQQFKVDAVECWQVQLPEDQEEDTSSNSKKKPSVLDKTGEDRVIMGLAGMKVDHSAGIREEPLEDL